VARRLATDPPRSTIRLNPFLIGDPQTPFASDLEGNGVPIWSGRREMFRATTRLPYSALTRVIVDSGPGGVADAPRSKGYRRLGSRLAS
jgi:hypothetical protein